MEITGKRNAVKGWFGKKRVFLSVFSFLLVSLLGVSSFYWDGTMAATGVGADSGIPGSHAFSSGSFAALSERLSPTVVNIKATKIEKTRGFHPPNGPEGPFGDFFGRYFGEMPHSPDNRLQKGAGSGVIISDDGYILSNNHVVEGARELSVTLSDKNEYAAKIVGRDPKTDLAVLKIDVDEQLPSAEMGDSDQLRVGDWVLAIGNPFGLSHTVTSGIVSAKGRIIGAGPYDDFIQTDASINPGNSGGPLFNMRGELVGINTAINAQGQGIGFAIPVNTAKPLIPQLVENGEVSRGYLGVNIQSMSPDFAKALKIKEDKGALVADVFSDSPADKAGVRRGDVIVAYNHEKVEDSHDLPALVAATPEGEDATITVIRDGKKKDLKVKVGRLPSESKEIEKAGLSEQDKWGLMLEDLQPGTVHRFGLDREHGVVVAGVRPGSPADLVGMQRGDIVLEVNQNAVDSVKDVKNQLDKVEDGDSLLLLVNRNRASFFAALKG